MVNISECSIAMFLCSRLLRLAIICCTAEGSDSVPLERHVVVAFWYVFLLCSLSILVCAVLAVAAVRVVACISKLLKK